MDQNLSNFDPPSSGEPTGGQQPRFRLNLQTVATVVLVVALVAIVWLFFGPQPEPDVSQALPTPTTQVAGTAGAITAAASPGAGTPQVAAAGSPAAIAGGTAVTAGTSAPITMATNGTSMAPAGAATAVATVPPAGVAAGAFVAIGNTDGYGIRLRFGPGADYATIRIILDGEVVQVVSGPESAEGLAWWRVQDNLGNVGWTAQDYLVSASPPANWAPPAASPTFQAGADTSGQAEATP